MYMQNRFLQESGARAGWRLNQELTEQANTALAAGRGPLHKQTDKVTKYEKQIINF